MKAKSIQNLRSWFTNAIQSWPSWHTAFWSWVQYSISTTLVTFERSGNCNTSCETLINQSNAENMLITAGKSTSLCNANNHASVDDEPYYSPVQRNVYRLKQQLGRKANLQPEIYIELHSDGGYLSAVMINFALTFFWIMLLFPSTPPCVLRNHLQVFGFLAARCQTFS